MATRPWLVPAAFILLGLIWGSSFLWIKIGVEEMDPRRWSLIGSAWVRWRC